MRLHTGITRVAILALLVTLAGHDIGAQRASIRQRWEYCAIMNASAKMPSPRDEKATAVASICYFQSIGCRTEEVTFDVDFAEVRKKLNATENQGAVMYAAREKATEGALAKAISKLGDDGWEMVNTGFRFSEDEKARAIYFKRRK